MSLPDRRLADDGKRAETRRVAQLDVASRKFIYQGDSQGGWQNVAPLSEGWRIFPEALKHCKFTVFERLGASNSNP